MPTPALLLGPWARAAWAAATFPPATHSADRWIQGTVGSVKFPMSPPPPPPVVTKFATYLFSEGRGKTKLSECSEGG